MPKGKVKIINSISCEGFREELQGTKIIIGMNSGGVILSDNKKDFHLTIVLEGQAEELGDLTMKTRLIWASGKGDLSDFEATMEMKILNITDGFVIELDGHAHVEEPGEFNLEIKQNDGEWKKIRKFWVIEKKEGSEDS